MSGIPRKRASHCCSECHRRKIRCDKNIPCSQCIAGGVGHSCVRIGSMTRFRKDTERSVPISAQAMRESTVISTSPPSSSAKQTELDEITNAATILEFLAWGKRKEISYVTEILPCVDQPDDSLKHLETSGDLPSAGSSQLDVLQLLLPSRDKVYLLARYHLDCLLWYHGSFHGPAFLKQLGSFYDCHGGQLTSRGLDSQWVALLFAVLTGSMACGNKAKLLSWGFQESEQRSLSRAWLEAVLSCLSTENYMANASILSCEAIATLTMSAHLLGYSNQQSVLLASAVRIAQSLGLHRLDESKGLSVERETGRRVWSQLCSQDWFSIAFTEAYLINPLHSKSSAPLNCCDESLQEKHPSIPTVTSYCRYLHSIAVLMPQLQDSLAMANTPFAEYEAVLSFDRKMRSLASEQRPTFLSNTPIDPSWPRWIPWARSAAAISSSHKIIMIHRRFLSASFTNPAFAFTRRTCVAASKTILKEVSMLKEDGGPVLWIVHAFTVAAGITLCLDALHRDEGDPVRKEHVDIVQRGISFLLVEEQRSKIASRGVSILKSLLSIVNGKSRLSNKRKYYESEPHGVKRSCSFDLRTVVEELREQTSPRLRRGLPVSTGLETPASSALDSEAIASTMASCEGFYTPAVNSDELWDTLYMEQSLPDDHDAFGSLLSLAQS